jgi:hypothetical protein
MRQCAWHGEGEEKCIYGLRVKSEGKNHLEKLGIEGRKILT